MITLNGTTGITNDGGYTGDGVVFADLTPANTLVTDTSGNVGVGTASPLTKIHAMSSAASVTFALSPNNSNTNIAYLTNDATHVSLGSSVGATGVKFRVALGAPDNAATIDSSGNFLVGTTSLLYGTGQNGLSVYTSGGYAITTKPASNNYNALTILNAAGTIAGSVYSTATATSFLTSSDYRLKNTIAPMTGALAKVALLKPCTYKWNVDSSNGQGFIAHELAEVVPECVTGEKDAVDENGNPQYQGIDTSFLVATLTAAIQELKAIVDAQSARITALETA